MNTSIRYPCVVYKTGYELIAAARTDERFPCDDDRYIVPKQAGLTPLHWIPHRLYDPMDSEHVTTYIDFAELKDKDDAAIIDFANGHGLLTEPDRWLRVQDKAKEMREPIMAEALTIWKDEIYMMGLALDLLHGVNTGDEYRLAKHIKVEEDKQLLVEITNSPLVSDSEQPFRMPPILTLFFDKGAAIVSVDREEIADLTLADKGRYFLAMLIDWKIKGAVHTVVRFDRKHGMQTLLAPSTLLSALWLRFAYDVQNVNGFILCDFCGEVIRSVKEKDINKPKRAMYKNRRYCSDKCRVKGSPGYKKKHPAKRN